MNVQPAQDPSGPSPQIYSVTFDGQGTDLAILVLKNFVLSALTFGIYSFWGKTEVRRWLWRHTSFHGDRFQFHGTGLEIFKGWLKVIGFFILLQGVLVGALFLSEWIGLLVQLAAALVFLGLIPFVLYSQQRYLMSRSTWRGIRFGMEPRASEYVKVFLAGWFLTVLTFGLYAPIWKNRLFATKCNNMYFGTAMMRYTGKDKEAFMMFLKDLPLIIITFGIYYIWHKAKVSRFRVNHLWIGSPELGAIRGELSLSGGDLFGLLILNFLLTMVTAGLATPWILANNMAFLMSRMRFQGNIDLMAVVRRESEGRAVADGLADAMDIGGVI